MSAKADSRILLLHKLRENLFRVRWTNDGQSLDGPSYKSDRKTLAYAYTLFCSLLVDLELLSLTESAKYVRKLADLDVSVVAKLYKELDAVLLDTLVKPRNCGLLMQRFKHIADENDWVLRPIRDLVRDLDCQLQVNSLRRLHQFLTFLSRVSLESVDGSKDIESFLERNASLRKVNVEIAKQLDPIITQQLQGVEFEPWGAHGNGATSDAGRVSRIEKTLFIKYDDMHQYFFRHFLNSNIDDYVPFAGCKTTEQIRVAKVTTVPKTALKRRIIAVETVTQQWFQQLVKNGLYRHIAKRWRSIPIFDQTVQQRRACIGSISGYYSTIDLSAASDSVSWDLVKTAFRHSGILPHLYATRSRRIQVGERVLPLNIYATMGSACCFPVECIIFDAICRLATQLSNYKRYDCTVYGDDIICPTSIAPLVMEILDQLGFTVNADKSYYDDSPCTFRESCGEEYWNGFSITPLRLSRRFAYKDVNRHPEQFDVMVDMANHFLERGFLVSRQLVLKDLLDQLEQPPIFGDLNGQIHTYDVATNYRAIGVRRNRDLQKLEFLGTVTRSVDMPNKYIVHTDYVHRDSKLRFNNEFSYGTDEHVIETVDHLRYFLYCADHHACHCDKTEAQGDSVANKSYAAPQLSSVAGQTLRLAVEWVSAF